MKFNQCYKIIIQSLRDWTNWTKIGKDAEYFGILDYCTLSDDEQITLYSWNPIPSDLEEYWLGDGSETGVSCLDFWPFGFDPLHPFAFALLDYIYGGPQPQ